MLKLIMIVELIPKFQSNEVSKDAFSSMMARLSLHPFPNNFLCPHWLCLSHSHLLQAACDTFCLDETMDPEAAAAALSTGDQTWAPGKFRLIPMPGQAMPDLCHSQSHFASTALLCIF